jgi:hypothetical protein
MDVYNADVNIPSSVLGKHMRSESSQSTSSQVSMPCPKRRGDLGRKLNQLSLQQIIFNRMHQLYTQFSQHWIQCVIL